MRKSILLTVLWTMITTISYAQFKPNLKNTQHPNVVPYELDDIQLIPPSRTGVPVTGRQLFGNSISHHQPLTFYKTDKDVSALKIVRDKKNELPIMLKGTMPFKHHQHTSATKATPTERSYAYLKAVKEVLQIESPQEEFDIIKIKSDNSGKTHIKMQQRYHGIEVYGAEVVLNTNENGVIRLFNGRYFPTPMIDNIHPSISKTAAIETAKQKLSREIPIKALSEREKQLVAGDPATADLVIFHHDLNPETERLAWKVTLIPNITTRRTLFVDAHSNEVVHEFNHVCQLDGGESCRHEASSKRNPTKKQLQTNHTPTINSKSAANGPAEADADDLFGINRTINTYEVSGNYYLVDAVRNMSRPSQSSYPNDPVGAIWTIDAFNTAPQNNNFNYDHVVSSNNNNWNATAVSAHHNAGKAYEYFENSHLRNSINGQGGNIISIINVTDENENSMGNAFWNGQAMFYGNGDNAFFPLARGLDVAGHEMAHGVVQATANLEYQGESGALNESMADVFGVLIDRDDWKIGEDVVKTSVFSSGALRDLQNPNNGGSGLSSPGWQPAHTSEQYHGNQDNGGVHINSGIPNRAFFLLASNIGKNKAEKIYYKALDKYLVRSSQFIDMRLAVINAAEEIHGNNSSEAAAAASAFTNVGIGNGSGTDTQEDIEVNPGEEFVLLSNESLSALFLANTNGNLIGNPLQNTGIISKPSVSDDGSFAAYIADDKTMRYYDFIQEQEFFLNESMIWRNVAVSKDGSRIAAVTDDFSNRVFVFDLNGGTSQSFDLYNPTFAEGIETGDVLYADVLEWAYDNESLMYDAVNVIEGSVGAQDIDYWDIGFMRVWNTNTQNYGDGTVSKLFSGLPEDVSVGNPTFAKNSPYIVAFDYIDNFEGENILKAANIETGDIEDIHFNSILSYPSYSATDGEILFDGINSGGAVLQFKQLAPDKITPANNQVFDFIPGGKWGTVFSTGIREVSSTTNFEDDDSFLVYPNPFDGQLTLEMKEAISNSSALQVSDVLGRVVYTQDIPSGTQTLNLTLENLMAGTYYLDVVVEGRKIVKKIVKF